jgi:Zn-dependent M28 family amino/carboxypeptidase
MQWLRRISLGLALGAAVWLVPVMAASAATPAQTTADETQAWRDLQHLAADAMAGRSTGSAGSLLAQQYLQTRFAELGLLPLGNSYLQPFTFQEGFSARRGVNVLGLRRGCSQPDRYIVVTAHYDHLKPRGQKIFNGADDNASGVAGLLYLAARTNQSCPVYSYLFLATDAEELGLDGAKAFLAQPPVALDAILLNINLDMISRGESNQRLYLAGKRQLPQLTQFAARAQTPLKLTLAHDGRQSSLGRRSQPPVDWSNASDHAVFRKAGIPFMYFGVDVHPQYHTPQDDWQRIDPQYFFAALRLIEQSRHWLESLPLHTLQRPQKSSNN